MSIMFKIYLTLIVTVIVVVAAMSYIDALKRDFYARPIGRRCRYKFNGRWIKGRVEWVNGNYFYLEPDEIKVASDLIHKIKVKPILFF